jgi:hypothetical protein
MSANFWCWVPLLALSPTSPDFLHHVEAFHNAPFEKPAPQIVDFVHRLTKVYPDLAGTEIETAWADGPMLGDANGKFIDFSIRWDYYDKVASFVISTGHHSGLNGYDPQTSQYYPLKKR